MADVYAGLYETRYGQDREKFWAMDGFYADGYIVAGQLTDALRVVDEHSFGGPSCVQVEQVEGQQTAPSMRQFGRHHCTYQSNDSTMPIPFVAQDDPVRILCGY